MRKHLCRKQGIKTSNKRQEESKVKKIKGRKPPTKLPSSFPNPTNQYPLWGSPTLELTTTTKNSCIFSMEMRQYKRLQNIQK